MSRKSDLENACLDGGWFAWSDDSQDVQITLPPERRDSVGNPIFDASTVTIIGHRADAVAWVRAHVQPGSPAARGFSGGASLR